LCSLKTAIIKGTSLASTHIQCWKTCASQEVGEPIVLNETVTPCLYDQIETVRNLGIQSKIAEIFEEIFDNNLEDQMYRFTESLNPNYPAQTQMVDDTPFQVLTDLNTTLLSNASREYTTLLIFHEIIHAILYYQGLQGSLHHSEILEQYVNEIAQVGQAMFPSLSLQDARSLAMAGLENVSQTQAYLDVMAGFGLTHQMIAETALSYRRDEVPGNIKKGTPCGN
jgi:hypothetical protein